MEWRNWYKITLEVAMRFQVSVAMLISVLSVTGFVT